MPDVRSPQASVAPEDVALGPIDWLWLTVPGLIWGTSFYLIAVGLEAFPPMLVTWGRVTFGMAAVWAFSATRAPVPRAGRPRIVLLGLIWMTIPLSMFPIAEQHVSSSVTGMLNGSMPIFAAMVAGLIARRMPPGRQLVGLVVGLAGVVLIALPTWSQGASSVGGILLIMFAMTCYGFAVNLAGPLQREFGALPVIGRALPVAVVVLAPFGIVGLTDASFSWRSFAAVTFLGVFGTGIAYVAMASNSGRYGATRAASSTYLIPGVSIILGVFVHGETLHLLALAGSIIALIGAYLVNSARRAVPATHQVGAVGTSMPGDSAD